MVVLVCKLVTICLTNKLKWFKAFLCSAPTRLIGNQYSPIAAPVPVHEIRQQEVGLLAAIQPPVPKKC